MNDEIKERLIETIRHLLKVKKESFERYKKAVQEKDSLRSDTYAVEITCILDEISDLYWVITGEYATAKSVEKILNIPEE